MEIVFAYAAFLNLCRIRHSGNKFMHLYMVYTIINLTFSLTDVPMSFKIFLIQFLLAAHLSYHVPQTYHFPTGFGC